MESIDLKEFIDGGGYIEVLLNEKRLAQLSLEKSTDFSVLANKFVFYNSDNSMKKDVYGKTFTFEGVEVNLSELMTRFVIIKNKFLKQFPHMEMPDIVIHKKLDYGSYACIDSRPLMSMPFHYLGNYHDFTLGHELGHHYLRFNKVDFKTAYTHWLWVSFGFLGMLCWNIYEVYTSAQAGEMMKTVLYLGLGSQVGLVLVMLISWFFRSKNYQVEFFCDDFSFWLNNDSNVKMYNYHEYPFLSSWTHPNNRSRVDRARKIEKFEDIKVERFIKEYYNFFCLDLMWWKKKEAKNG